MGKTGIAWTNYSTNPIRFRNIDSGKPGWFCQKVSSECAHCYAETLNLKFGNRLPFNAASGKRLDCFFDDKMAGELYKIKAPARVFPFDMTDIFGDFIPDFIRAAAWLVMLDLPQHTFQVLTKRPAAAHNWQERFTAAIHSEPFLTLRRNVKNPAVQKALMVPRLEVWPQHIWFGTSVGDSRSIGRIDDLRACPAPVKFLSCEPLLTSLGKLDLSGIAWVIAGGESGYHLKQQPERGMQMGWACDLKEQCVDAGVAFFFKQQSGGKPGEKPYLIEPDGSRWQWQQFPDDRVPPVRLNMDGTVCAWEGVTPLDKAKRTERLAYLYRAVLRPGLPWWSDNAALAADYWYQQARVANAPYRNILSVPDEPAPQAQTLSAQLSLF